MTTDCTPNTSIWRHARWAASLAGLMILIALAAACSGGSSSPGVASVESTPTPASGSSSTGSAEPNALAYSQCMRDHGLPNFPDPNSEGQIVITGGPESGLDPDSPQFQAAQEACKSLEPRPPSAEQQTQDQTAMLKYSQCMRDQGISNFPDPQPGGGLQLDMGTLGVDPNSPQYQAADEACKQYLPGGGEGRGFNEEFNNP